MIAAVVPAAGRSQRMGRPKLLLPIGGDSLIGRVVTALREGAPIESLWWRRRRDSEEGPAVAAQASQAGAFVVAPTSRGPPRCVIRSSSGSSSLAGPTPPDHVLLAPGDAAGITPGLVARLLEESARRTRAHHRAALRRPRRGHPLVLPWTIALEIASLPSGQGRQCALDPLSDDWLFELPVSDSRMADDIDTPDDFRLWQERPAEGLSSERGAGDRQEAAVGALNRVQVPVRFFALAKDRAGCSTIDLELAAGSRVRDLRDEIARAACPGWRL